MRRVGNDEKSGEIAFVGLNVLGEHLESVELCGVGAADGGVVKQLCIGYLLGASGSVVAFNHLHSRVFLQKFLALHKCNGVRSNFGDVGDGLSRQGNQRLRDVFLVFAYDGQVALSKQFVIL